MKQLIFALVFGFLIAVNIEGAPLISPDSKSSNNFRVMSFNIRYDEPRDGQNAWPNRKAMVASIVRLYQADLVGVQEALKGQLDDLLQLLPEYSLIGVGRSDGRSAGEFSAILYRKIRFKLVTSATFWLSESPQTPGSKGWDAALPRIVTWGQFEDQETGKRLFHFNTHFDHRGELARTQSATLLRREIEKIARAMPVVVTGDFNFRETSDAYRILTEQSRSSSLKDARYLSQHPHHGPTSTFNEFKALVPGMKIDFILVNEKIRVLQHAVLSDTWDGRFPSDHLPVLAEISIE
jgi:endonuclease/exonuclease/phosphatase family metal-dependent hydrolase